MRGFFIKSTVASCPVVKPVEWLNEKTKYDATVQIYGVVIIPIFFHFKNFHIFTTKDGYESLIPYLMFCKVNKNFSNCLMDSLKLP